MDDPVNAVTLIVLTKEQRAAGMYLIEDDHTVSLMRDGVLSPLAVFTTEGTNIEEIRAKAEEIIAGGECIE